MAALAGNQRRVFNTPALAVQETLTVMSAMCGYLSLTSVARRAHDTRHSRQAAANAAPALPSFAAFLSAARAACSSARSTATIRLPNAMLPRLVVKARFSPVHTCGSEREGGALQAEKNNMRMRWRQSNPSIGFRP